MPSEWETVPLESLVEPKRGISYGIVQPGAPVTNGIPIVRVSDVRNGRVAVSNPLRVAPSIEAAYARTRLAGGELLLTLVGTVGEAAIAPPSLAGWNTARAVAVIPVRKEIGAYWVKLALQAPGVREIINSRLNTTVQATLNLGDVAKLPIVLPPSDERKAIAHILGTLDDKILLNQQMNETLEGIARLFFKSWFVDFDSVRAKAEGRDSGLPKPLSDLFPDSLEDSEMGMIPKGWLVGRLGDLAGLDKGLSYKGEGLVDDGGLPMVNLGCFAGEGLFKTQNIKRYRGDFKERHLVKTGDLLVANTDMTQNRIILGSPALLPKIDGEDCFLFTHHTFAMRFKLGAERWRRYVYFTLLQPEFREVAEGFATGTTVLALPKDGLLNLSLVLPCDLLLNAFERQVEPIFVLLDKVREQSRTLVTLRDTLLPKLITGEIRVRDPGRFSRSND